MFQENTNIDIINAGLIYQIILKILTYFRHKRFPTVPQPSPPNDGKLFI